MRKAILSFALLLLAVAAVAQGFTGGITATVVNRSGRLPIEGAKVVLTQGDEAVASVTTGPDGKFGFSGLDNGSYTLSVEAEDFVGTQINVLVEKGFVRDLVFVTLSPSSSIKEDIDDSNFAEFDLTDTGYSDAPTILFGSNDVYSKVAGYGFSAVRFKNRGYNSESQDVLLAGVNMNDAITGYSPFSLWSGLNEAMRSTETSMGNETADFGVGGFNGQTNSKCKAQFTKYFDIIKVNKTWKAWKKEALPGDICFWPGHTNVYAGSNKTGDVFYDSGRHTTYKKEDGSKFKNCHTTFKYDKVTVKYVARFNMDHRELDLVIPDISHWEPVRDWAAVKRCCPFIITKATQG